MMTAQKTIRHQNPDYEPPDQVRLGPAKVQFRILRKVTYNVFQCQTGPVKFRTFDLIYGC